MYLDGFYGIPACKSFGQTVMMPNFLCVPSEWDRLLLINDILKVFLGVGKHHSFNSSAHFSCRFMGYSDLPCACSDGFFRIYVPPLWSIPILAFIFSPDVQFNSVGRFIWFSVSKLVFSDYTETCMSGCRTVRREV